MKCVRGWRMDNNGERVCCGDRGGCMQFEIWLQIYAVNLRTLNCLIYIYIYVHILYDSIVNCLAGSDAYRMPMVVIGILLNAAMMAIHLRLKTLSKPTKADRA